MEYKVIFISEDLHKLIKVEAVKRNITMGEMVRESFCAFVDKHNDPEINKEIEAKNIES